MKRFPIVVALLSLATFVTSTTAGAQSYPMYGYQGLPLSGYVSRPYNPPPWTEDWRERGMSPAQVKAWREKVRMQREIQAKICAMAPWDCVGAPGSTKW